MYGSSVDDSTAVKKTVACGAGVSDTAGYPLCTAAGCETSQQYKDGGVRGTCFVLSSNDKGFAHFLLETAHHRVTLEVDEHHHKEVSLTPSSATCRPCLGATRCSQNDRHVHTPWMANVRYQLQRACVCVCCVPHPYNKQ